MHKIAQTDSRKHFRMTPEKQHPIRVDINGENFLDILYAHDISEGGLGIFVHHAFKDCEIDKAVSLVVRLPHPTVTDFSVNGKIKHVSAQKFGIEFLDTDRTVRNKIRSYLGFRLKNEPWLTRIKFRLGLLKS